MTLQDSIFQRIRNSLLILLMVGIYGWAAAAARAATFSGTVTDPQGRVVPRATIRLLRRADSSRREATTGDQGQFTIGTLDIGEYQLSVEASGFPVMTRTIVVMNEGERKENLQFSQLASQNESVTVSADVSDVGVFAPDPAQRIMIRDETLDANPGRPGMPISIPGMPVESPAGGVKPPQYFVPGVAGDHGEPIAMFFQVGGFLFQNNLPANAHGNGYADTLLPAWYGHAGRLPHETGRCTLYLSAKKIRSNPSHLPPLPAE